MSVAVISPVYSKPLAATKDLGLETGSIKQKGLEVNILAWVAVSCRSNHAEQKNSPTKESQNVSRQSQNNTSWLLKVHAAEQLAVPALRPSTKSSLLSPLPCDQFPRAAWILPSNALCPTPCILTVLPPALAVRLKTPALWIKRNIPLVLLALLTLPISA